MGTSIKWGVDGVINHIMHPETLLLHLDVNKYVYIHINAKNQLGAVINHH